MIKRWYYLLFYRDRCFRNTLEERSCKWTDFVFWSDKYLGNNWWLKKKIL